MVDRASAWFASMNTMAQHTPSPLPTSWTFALWLAFQRDRADAVGALARAVAADAAWPGGRSLEGLTAYGYEQHWPATTLATLPQAWAEWQTVRDR
jgi:hypothetical protein